jgi:hypothetical protein
MPSTTRHRWFTARTVVAALAVPALMIPFLAGPAGAAPTARDADGARGSTSTYVARLQAALETCQKSVDRPDDPAALSRCVWGLAAPDPKSSAEIDLFRVFTDCLAEAAGPDSMYPGVDPAEVNQCLEDHGVL